MYIHRIYIENYHGIEKCEINFSQKNQDGGAYILIGDNGCGKTTIFEAIYMVFGSLRTPALLKHEKFGEIEIEYSIEMNRIILSLSNTYLILNGEKIDFQDFDYMRKYMQEHENIFLPDGLFTFYCGFNDRMKATYRKILAVERRLLTTNLNEYLRTPEYKRNSDCYLYRRNEFMHCSNESVVPYLASIMWSPNKQSQKYLQDYCRIKKLDEVCLEVDKKRILSYIEFPLENISNKDLELVRNTVHEIIKYIDSNMIGACTIEISSTIRIKIKMDGVSENRIYNFMENMKYIFRANISANIISADDVLINDKSLSEGQIQFIRIVGLFNIIPNGDTLVLMDEPDSHMNPRWKYELKGIIDNISPSNSMTILATHDPLIVNGSDTENVRILNRLDNVIEAVKPLRNARGMGIDGLLKSQYFGFETTLDQDTNNMIIRRQQLFIKELNEIISDAEREELAELREQIGRLDYINNVPTDPYYSEYVRMVSKLHSEMENVFLSEEEEEKRLKIVRDIFGVAE